MVRYNSRAGAEFVRNAQRLQRAERLLCEVGVVDDDQVGWLRDWLAVEVHPVVHYTDRLGLVIVVKLGAAVVLRDETDGVEAQLLGLFLGPLCQLAGAGQVSHGSPPVESQVCDEEGQQGFAFPGGHLDRQVACVEIIRGVSRENLALAGPELLEGGRLEGLKARVEVRHRCACHRSLSSIPGPEPYGVPRTGSTGFQQGPDQSVGRFGRGWSRALAT
jgi:hypothetical protein